MAQQETVNSDLTRRVPISAGSNVADALVAPPDVGESPQAEETASRSSSKVALFFLLMTALLTACTAGGPGTQEELQQILAEDGNLDETQASCVASAVFEEYGEDNDALSKISAADSLSDLEGENGVAGFNDFYSATLNGCTTVGVEPTG